MTHLLIIGYYYFADGYLALGQYFNKFFDSVSFLPIYEFNDKINNNIDCFDDIENIINGSNIINNYISLINHKFKKTHIIIWHNINFINDFRLNEKNFSKYIIDLKSKYNFKLYMFNWDPNINIFLDDDILKHFDILYISDLNSILTNNNLLYNIKPFNQGYSPITSYHISNDNYICDVSFIGTNLYTDNFWTNKSLNRKIILDEIYKNKNIKLHVYGTEILKRHYPDSYKGFISYDKCKYVFSNSLINLNISPLKDIEYQDNYYYSERLPQILGCNGVMLSNNNYNKLLTPNEDYIYIEDIKDLIPKILYYLTNKDELNKIRDNFNKKLKIFNYENIINDFIKDMLV